MSTVNFQKAFEQMKAHGLKLPEEKTKIAIPNAKENLKAGLAYFMGEDYKWLPEYNQIAKWMENNEGKGLFLYGNCGRGKTVISRYVIPAILVNALNKVVKSYDMQELNLSIDEALSKKIVCIDDIGTENEIVNYGDRRVAFAEMIDNAEKNGAILIMTTNLTDENIKTRYGDRVLDRIKSVSTRILFKGESLRK